jgi:hypothetical protein
MKGLSDCTARCFTVTPDDFIKLYVAQFSLFFKNLMTKANFSQPLGSARYVYTDVVASVSSAGMRATSQEVLFLS